MMKVAIVSTGYVGLVTRACLAHLGHEVMCLDDIDAKVRSMNEGEVPIFEPGLEDLLKKGLSSGKLMVTTDHAQISNADIVFRCVGKPSVCCVRNSTSTAGASKEKGMISAICKAG